MVDELFLTKKLKEVEFIDFDTSVDDYLQTQTDLDKIKGYYQDQGQMDAELTEHAKAIFSDRIYQVGTVRGAINAVLSKVREQVYAKLSKEAVDEKVEDGDYSVYEGTILGAYDWEIEKDTGGTFIKNFMVLSTVDKELKEITCIGDKIGSRRYGIPIPWRKKASFVINPKEFTRANGSTDIDHVALRVGDIEEGFISLSEELAIADHDKKIWDIDKMVEEFPPEGILAVGEWIWVKGIVREIAPFPVFEDRLMTGRYNHLSVPDKFGEPAYAFNLMLRGKFFDDEIFYPNVRMQPITTGYTEVEWTKGLEDMVEVLIESQTTMDPTDQFVALNNEVVDREVFALVKLQKIEHQRGQSRDPERSGEQVDRYYINLNAVFVKFTDNYVPYTPPEKEDAEEEPKEEEPKEEKPAKKPPAKKPPKRKPATPSKATAWKKAAEKKIKEWMEVIPDASFETLVENDIFTEDVFKGVEQSALEKVYNDLVK